MNDSERISHFEPLGLQRQRIFHCLGGNDRHSPLYCSPNLSQNVFDEYSNYVKRVCAAFESDTDSLTKSLIAAARLLNGEVEAAQTIIDCLPNKPFKLDHGAGYCIVAPLYSLKAALPLPEHLCRTDAWTAGSAEQDELRVWLRTNSSKLVWFEREGVYKLPEH